jgi:hypothetical protein
MMKTLDEFKELYEKQLVPALNELDGRRKRILLEIILVDILGVALMAAPIVLGLLGSVITPDYMMPCCCIGGVLFVVGVMLIGFGNNMLTRSYVKDFKSNIVGKIIKFIDEGLEYEPKRGIALSAYKDSRIFLQGVDRYHGEDWIGGMVGKTKVEFSEVHSEYKTEYHDSKGHRHTQWHTIFRGIFFIADFNKEFKSATLVLPDFAEKTFGGLIGSFLQSKNIGRPDLIKMEDPDFEKEFVVYGSDQIEARYILSPSLMERMTNFKRKTGKNIYFSFVGSKVMMAIPYNKDLFEPRVFHSIVNFGEVKSYYEDLSLIVGIVEELNLNTRIWSKQ